MQIGWRISKVYTTHDGYPPRTPYERAFAIFFSVRVATMGERFGVHHASRHLDGCRVNGQLFISGVELDTLPYNGKFSWVQIFTEIPRPPDPPEEIFVVFIFMGCACSSDHTPIFTCTLHRTTHDECSLVKIFVVFISLLPVSQQKPRKFAPHENILLYDR